MVLSLISRVTFLSIILYSLQAYGGHFESDNRLPTLVASVDTEERRFFDDLERRVLAEGNEFDKFMIGIKLGVIPLISSLTVSSLMRTSQAPHASICAFICLLYMCCHGRIKSYGHFLGFTAANMLLYLFCCGIVRV